MSYKIKIEFNGEIHILPKPPRNLDDLKKTITKAFKKDLPSEWRVEYKDAEDDLITLVDDEALDEMIDFDDDHALEVRKLYIRPINKAKAKAQDIETDLFAGIPMAESISSIGVQKSFKDNFSNREEEDAENSDEDQDADQNGKAPIVDSSEEEKSPEEDSSTNSDDEEEEQQSQKEKAQEVPQLNFPFQKNNEKLKKPVENREDLMKVVYTKEDIDSSDEGEIEDEPASQRMKSKDKAKKKAQESMKQPKKLARKEEVPKKKEIPKVEIQSSDEEDEEEEARKPQQVQIQTKIQAQEAERQPLASKLDSDMNKHQQPATTTDKKKAKKTRKTKAKEVNLVKGQENNNSEATDLSHKQPKDKVSFYPNITTEQHHDEEEKRNELERHILQDQNMAMFNNQLLQIQQISTLLLKKTEKQKTLQKSDKKDIKELASKIDKLSEKLEQLLAGYQMLDTKVSQMYAEFVKLNASLIPSVEIPAQQNSTTDSNSKKPKHKKKKDKEKEKEHKHAKRKAKSPDSLPHFAKNHKEQDESDSESPEKDKRKKKDKEKEHKHAKRKDESSDSSPRPARNHRGQDESDSESPEKDKRKKKDRLKASKEREKPYDFEALGNKKSNHRDGRGSFLFAESQANDSDTDTDRSKYDVEIERELMSLPPTVSTATNTVVKPIQLRNVGKDQWPKNLILEHVQGIKGAASNKLSEAKPGAIVSIALTLLGPFRFGTQTSTWQLRYTDKHGRLRNIGKPIKITLIVNEPNRQEQNAGYQRDNDREDLSSNQNRSPEEIKRIAKEVQSFVPHIPSEELEREIANFNGKDVNNLIMQLLQAPEENQNVW